MLKTIVTWFVVLGAPLSILLASALAQAPPASSLAGKTMDVYFIDTEGGQATLFVSPTSGESMLVDTGFAGGVPDKPETPAAAALPPIGRDASRIMEVLKQAQVTVLDYVVITHYHGDHVGGVAELATRIPIRNFVDHGPYTVELQPNRAAGFIVYKTIRPRSRHRPETRRQDSDCGL